MTTTTVYADTSDAHMYVGGANYTISNCRSYGDAFYTNDDNYMTLGQHDWNDHDGTWSSGSQGASLQEALTNFDTSSIPDGDTVSSAIIALRLGNDQSDTDFTIQARSHDWGDTASNADWLTHTELASATLRATLATSTFSGSGSYYNFTSESGFAAAVNKTGKTRLIFCSDRHVSQTNPTLNMMEVVTFDSANASGTTSDPKLTVEHAAAGSGPTTVSTYMGVAKASISSVDSVAIANIDSINSAT